MDYSKYLYDASQVDLYIANLGKYNEGELEGGWISLPTEEETIREFLDKVVGINKDYEEWAIHDYQGELIKPDEYDDIFELNEQAEKLSELNEWEIKTLKAAVEYFGQEAFDYELEDFILYEDIHTHYDLGYYWAEESGCYQLDGMLARYFDYEAFGRDIEIETCGGFTKYGFIELTK